MNKILTILSMIFISLTLYGQTLQIEVNTDKANVLSCETYKYTFKYKCASTTTNCTQVTRTGIVPANATFPTQTVGLTSDIQSYTFSADRKTINFVFKEPLTAGNTGIIEVIAMASCGVVDGSVATLTGTILSGGVPEMTAQVSTTIFSYNKFCPSKAHGVGLAIDGNTVYNIGMSFAGNGYGSNGYGTTSVTNVTMVDNLPPNTIINSVSLNFNNGQSDLVLPPNTCVIDNTPSSPNVTCTFPPSTFEIISNYAANGTVSINVTYPGTSFNAGDNVTNSVDVTYTPLGGSPITASNGTVINYQDGTNYGSTTPASCTANLDVTDPLANPNPILQIRKTASPSTIRPGDNVRYEINVSNTGNTILNDVVVEDIIPSELEVTTIGDYQGFYGMSGTEIRTLMIKTVSNPTYTTVSLPYIATSGDYVTAIKSTISSIPAGGQLLYLVVIVKLKPNITTGTVTNCLTGSTSTPGATINSSSACVVINVAEIDNFSTLAMDKFLTHSPNSQYASFYGAPQIIGTTVWSSIYVENQSGGQPLQNPVVADLLPPGLEYDGDIQYGTSSCSNYPHADNTEIIPNYQGTGRTLVRLSWNTPLPSGCGFWVSIKTKITSLAPGGTANDPDPTNAYNVLSAGVKNSAFFTGSSPQKCLRKSIYNPKSYYEAPDLLDIDNDGLTTTDTICRAYYYLNITSSAQLTSVKWVKGQLDTDYHKYPNSGYTMPGGLANYKLIVANDGNVPATSFEIIDILPFVGDGGVIDLTPRLTQWRPNLVTPVFTPAGITVYYSTSPNPCRTDYVASGPSGCTPANWTTVLPEDPTTIQSLKISFNDIVLNPGDQIELTWDMRAPVNAPTNGEIAWNSFGYKAIREDNNDPFLPAEPFKVGIAIQPLQPGSIGNYIWCDTNDNGIQDSGEQGLDGVRVELYQDNGDGVSNPYNDIFVSFTATGNGGLYTFPDLPPGNYYVVIYTPVGGKISPVDATADDFDSDGTGSTFNGHSVVVTPVTNIGSAEFDNSWDQGFVCNYYATVGNYVWYDENQDNIQNESATNGINGITVQLYTSAGTLVATTVTADDRYGRPGYYLFENLQPGNYYVKFNLNSDMTFTTGSGTQGGTASDELDSDPSTTGVTPVFNLGVGETDLTWDAGIILQTGPYKLGNFVWNDANNNGVWDTGEAGINNVKVDLYKDINGDNIPQTTEFITSVLTTTVSGISGIYKFDNLPSGTYLVVIPNSSLTSVLNGFQSSTGNDPAPDPDDNVENDDNGTFDSTYGVISQNIYLGDIAEPLESGYANYSVDFGFYLPPPCNISSVSATPGSCAANLYTLTGNVNFSNPPATGTLTVSVAGGGSQVFNAPFSSSISYSISNLTADGASHTVTAIFSANMSCSNTTTYTAPPVCVLPCSLTSAGKTNEQCNNNGTVSTGSDDYITFSLNPSGLNLASGYTVSVSGGGTITPSSGTYGSASNFRLQNGSANGTTYTITITDNGSSSCTTTTTVVQQACSTCPPPDCLNVQMKKN